jgi:hypothetical protein
MGIKCPECNTVNSSDSKYCNECATPLPSSKKIPVTETLETPTEELIRGTRFSGKHEIIHFLNFSFKAERTSPSKIHEFFIIQRNL